MGIRIVKIGPDEFYLTKPGVTEKVMQAGGMSNANGVNTSTTGDPVGADLEGTDFNEEWEYRSIVCMLMYLAANAHPHIAYALHQAARLSHTPKNNHALAIKRIFRHFKNTQDKGFLWN